MDLCLRAKERQKQKFDTLIHEREGNRAGVTSHMGKWVINLSSKQLSDQQEKVLAKGLKFAPALKSIPIKEIATVEPALRTAPHQATANARVRIVSLLSKAKPPQSNISKEESHAIRSLKTDPDLVILQADKGCSTVILDRCMTRSFRRCSMIHRPTRRSTRTPPPHSNDV